jgi:hypothetical protein
MINANMRQAGFRGPPCQLEYLSAACLNMREAAGHPL